VELLRLPAELPEAKLWIARGGPALNTLGNPKDNGRETGLVAIKFSSVRGYKS
jgi:hypothetical protein